MAKQVTLWGPDTCGCEIEFEWDDAVPVETRTVAHKRTVTRCAAHQLATGSALFDTVLDENRRKNYVFAEILRVKSDAAPEGYVWSYDAARVLKVSLGTIVTTAQKTQLQTACNTRFGAGKVQVT